MTITTESLRAIRKGKEVSLKLFDKSMTFYTELMFGGEANKLDVGRKMVRLGEARTFETSGVLFSETFFANSDGLTLTLSFRPHFVGELKYNLFFVFDSEIRDIKEIERGYQIKLKGYAIVFSSRDELKITKTKKRALCLSLNKWYGESDNFFEIGVKYGKL